MSLLELFQEAYRNLELAPLLSPKELEQFRVEYGEEIIEELVQLVEDSASAASKIVFCGHTGCGKSTLLAEFSRILSDRYFVVLFSIAKAIEQSDVDQINILFAIAVNLMKEAAKQGVSIPKSTREIVYQWLAEETETDVREFKGQADLGLKFLENVSVNLQTNGTLRKEIKRKFERNDSRLVEQLNIIAAALQSATQKNVLVIIDDLDKLNLSVVEPIFRNNIKTLCLPGFHIVYTIPISLMRDKEIKPFIETETNDQMLTMPVVKLLSKEDSHKLDAVPRQEVMDTLCEILSRRIPDHLLDRSTAEKLILYSGGVLRELIRIANECCRICLRLVRRQPDRTDIKITDDILEQAVNNIRNDFALRLGKKDYAILQQVYQNFMPEDPTEKAFLDLLHGLHVLEYRNRKIWYDVHPIVVELLRDEELI